MTLQRRRWLKGLLAGGVAGVCPPLWAAQDPHAMHGMQNAAGASTTGSAPASVKLLDAQRLPRGAPLNSVARLQNQSTQAGLFKATLTAAPTRVPLVTGLAPTEFWAYNAGLPGPLIEVFEGDQVEITFVNQLRQPSTIHWHGLPVPPDQDGSPWDVVAPGAQRVYRFTVPQGSAATYWYHPHPHHHTAEQAFRGMAGPLMVRSRNDPLAGLPERLLVISDLKLDSKGAIAPSDANDLMDGREGQFTLVNAQHQPVLPFHASGIERWRVLNASSARYLRLALPGNTVTLVGTDGGLVPKPQSGLKELLLIPGQRVELIVQAGPRRNRIPLMANVYDRGKMGDAPPDKARTLLTVDFSGVKATAQDDAAFALPRSLADIPDLGEPKARKRVVFSESMSMKGGVHRMQFLVNGREFDMNRVDLTSRAGEVELWELANESDMDHPFHLHGTQFQVVQRQFDGQTTPEPYRAWRDMVNLRSGETVLIKTVQRDPGLRMFHCHTLEHEMAGMMGLLKVV